MPRFQQQQEVPWKGRKDTIWMHKASLRTAVRNGRDFSIIRPGIYHRWGGEQSSQRQSKSCIWLLTSEASKEATVKYVARGTNVENSGQHRLWILDPAKLYFKSKGEMKAFQTKPSQGDLWTADLPCTKCEQKFCREKGNDVGQKFDTHKGKKSGREERKKGKSETHHSLRNIDLN